MSTTWDDELTGMFGEDEEATLSRRVPVQPDWVDVPGLPDDQNRSAMPEPLDDGKQVKRGRRMLNATETKELTNRLARCLPYSIRADRRISAGMLRYLAVLKYLSRGSNETDRSVPEIANRAACSERSVQNYTLLADKYGLIHCEKRPKSPRWNDTNIYTLMGEMRNASGGAKKDGVKNLKHRYISSTSTQEDRIKDVGSRRFAKSRLRENFSQPGKPKPLKEVAAKPFKSEKIKPLPPAPPPDQSTDTLEDQVSLAKRALSEILPGMEVPDTKDEIIHEIERLRSERIPSFSESAWRVVTRRHGFKAHLAVLETQLMAEIKADTDPINSLPGYLGGILWKPPGDGPGHPNPASTLRDIMATRAEWKDAA